jgi:ABC-type Zn uptake system ZnuABC Zn-binding protein ZnuA
MGRRRVALAAVMTTLLLAGCATPTPRGPWREHADGPRVVATTTQVADMAAVIGSDRIDLFRLLKPGIDAHDYEPSPADVEAVAGAQLVVENGVGLERWLHDTIESSGYDGPVVDTSQGVRLREVGGEPDPHIWQDPRNAQIMAANIERAMAAADPADAGVFEANLDAYTKKLQALDAEV